MVKVMFVCLGNICRSPMAEFVFKDIVKKQGLEKEFYIKSSATSSEEIGNDIHYGTRDKLIQNGIPFTKRKAVKLRAEDYKKYDYIITNPPIRAGKEVVRKFLFGGYDYLNDNGMLYFVMRKDHGVKSMIKELESKYNVTIVNKDKGFYIVSLTKHL